MSVGRREKELEFHWQRTVTLLSYKDHPCSRNATTEHVVTANVQLKNDMASENE